MTDHKYTDDEIIHSLKVCSNDGDCIECLINPHKGNYGYCTSLAIKAALDLINRQKAEIERLNTVHADMTESLRLAAEANKDMQAEIKRLKDKYECFYQPKAMIKSEAIKEFAERLVAIYENDKTYDRPNAHTLVVTVFRNIDNLVKEMTEEQTNESQST